MARTKLKLPREFSFSTELMVRVSDVNYGGHLSNEKVLAMMHEARARYLAQFDFTELNVDGSGTIQTEAIVIYKSASFHGDLLKVEVTPDNFHRHGCDFFYKISNSSTHKEVARGKTGMVFFDYEARKMIPAPIAFLKLCAPEADQ